MTIQAGAVTAPGRLRHALTAAWGTFTGIAPHVLHHVGPLAGAAFLAGTGGRVLFFLIGLAATTPLLIRLYRRFQTWVAPAIAVAVFAVTYTLSSLLLGPLITGEEAAGTPASTPTTIDHHGHQEVSDSATG
jgi:hypothetical protein